MATIWKTLKVFISSTFRDMELERDRLADTFHRLEKSLFLRQLTVRPYDLRWRDRYTQEPLVEWCVRMVAECDYFIGILGDRYGWRPPFGAGGEANTANVSITEMEIKTALAKIAPGRRFFCFTQFTQASQETAADLAAMQNLKEFLQRQGETIYVCNHIEELMAAIQEHFRKIVDAEYPCHEKVAPLRYTYRQSVDDIVAEKVSGFVGRSGYLRQILQFAEGTGFPNYLGIQAVAGTGKSALLARFIQECRQPLVAHFMSMAGDARELGGILRSIGEQLYALQIITGTLAFDMAELQSQIRHGLEQHRGQLVLVIDGLDEIGDHGRDLQWLPASLPANIRVIVSSRPVEVWEALQKYPALQSLELSPLDEVEIRGIIEEYSTSHALSITPGDKQLLQKRAAGNPLFLKVALDEILSTGIAVGQLAITVESLFDQILDRVEKEYQQKFQRLAEQSPSQAKIILARDFINDYLGLIAVVRAGIQERELAEILEVGDDFLYSLTQALKNFIILRKDSLHFFHPEFERTIKMRHGKMGMRKYHLRFADYLAKQGYSYIRSVDELPYQLQWGEQYEELLRTLTALDFWEAKCRMGMTMGLLEDLSLALQHPIVPLPEHLALEVAPGVRVSRKTVRLMSRALEMEAPFVHQHPQSVFQTLWNLGYWHDAPEAERHYVALEAGDHAPWRESGDKLYRLMEHWRQQREVKGGVWCRSLRPLLGRLDSPLLKILRGHEEAITRLAVTGDGKIVSASSDTTLRVWDMATGTALLTLAGHERIVSCMQLTADGSRIASASTDKTIRIWDTKTGVSLANWEAHKKDIGCIAIAPDGTLLASGSVDKSVRIWELATGTLRHTLNGHKTNISELRFSPDGRKLVSASHDNTIRIWDVQKGAILHILKGHEEHVSDIAITPDGKKLISSSYDNTLRIWDMDKGTLLHTLQGHGRRVATLAINANGTRVASGAFDNTVRVWDIGNGQLVHTLQGHTSMIQCVTFSPDGSKIASAGGDFSVRIWETATGRLSNVFKGHGNKVVSLLFTPDGSKVISGSQDFTIRIWTIRSGGFACALAGHTQKIDTVVHSDDGNKIISAATDCRVCVWDSATGLLVQELRGHSKYVAALAVSQDGHRIASGSGDTTIGIWNVKTWKMIHKLEGHSEEVACLAWHADGRRIASGSGDATARIWDAQTGKSLHLFQGHEKAVKAVLFSRNGDQLITASHDGTIRIWNSQTGKLCYVLQGHRDKITSIALSHTDHLVSTSADQTIRVWNIHDGKPLQTLRLPGRWTYNAVFSEDGQKIISASRDKMTRIWNIETGECVKTLDGYGDLLPIAKGCARQVLVRDVETVIQDRNDNPIATFPGIVNKATLLPQNCLTGYIGDYLYLLQLSGSAASIL